MGGKIDAFVDCSSPYSYIAFDYLRRQRELLTQYGVEVEFHPVFLGGINVATSNVPPTTNKTKAHYAPYDMTRASAYYHLSPLSSPPFFPMLSLLPQRVALVLKSTLPTSRFESIYSTFWPAVYTRHIDLSKAEELVDVLKISMDEGEARRVVEMAGTKEFKELLNSNTKRALESGAFGAPWFVLSNFETGVKEPLFGSDRWGYMFRFLGVEIEELRIVDREGEGKGYEKARL